MKLNGAVRHVAHLPIRLAAVVMIFLFFRPLPLRAFAELEIGQVGGITRDAASGKPVPEVQVVARNHNTSSTYSSISDASGIFTFHESGARGVRLCR